MKTAQHHILETYLRRLTNLSGRNRSLLLLRLGSEQLLDVQQLTFLNGEKSFGIVEALIAGKIKKICPLHDSRMEAANEASKKLKKLQRIDKFIFEERGSNDLHIGWPIVRGKFSDGTLVRCPLLYLPVVLNQDGNNWVVQLRKEAGIVFNKSFLLAYAFYNNLKPNEELLETSFEEFDTDSIGFRTQLYNLLKERLEINFNPDTYSDELSKFEEFKKREFEDGHKNGELKLFPEAVLGIFPQAGSQLVPDYLQLLENQSFVDLEDFFTKRIINEPMPPSPWVVKEEKIYTPLSLDAYQEHAIRSIKIGQSIVVQGPPGTGKSQLICNLLADSIASGKRTLLVCQKRVALDVVYDRLQKLDLGDFLGLVHDFRNDRKNIYDKVARQINKVEDYKALNRSADAIHLERRFSQVSRQIDQVVEELEEFRKYLFDEEECGISIKELYLTSSPHRPSVLFKQEYQYFNFREIDGFISKLKSYVKYAALFDDESNLWNNRKSFASFHIGDLRTIEKTIQDIEVKQTQIQEELSKRISNPFNLEDCENLLARQREAEEMLGLLRDEKIWSYFLVVLEEKDEETSMLWLQNMERVCLNCFEGAGIESSLTTDQFDVCQAALHQRMLARKSLIRWIRWELFSDHKFLLKRVLITNGLPFDKSGFQMLAERIDNRLNLEHHLTTLKTKAWLKDLPTDINKQQLSDWFQAQKKAIQAKLIFASLRELRKAVRIQQYSQDSFQELMREIFTIISTVPFHSNDWQQYLSTFQIKRLIQEPSLAKDYIKHLRNDFDKLCEFDKVKESLSKDEWQAISKVHDELGHWNVQEIEQLFQNSLRLAWINHIETKHPVLRAVSTLKMEELESTLQQCVEEKQKLSKEITLLRARERVYESMQYNRLNNPTTYRDLLHQVTKKKKIWPVRKTIAEFQDELFNLVPCWLASPEAVSAIFPMEEIFDLVIFDEASQCFSERGIPSMYRAKQLLVAGDSKQLRPFELYQARWEEETEDPDEEVDSLLELSERYLPTVHLQAHYRSQSIALINFSNQHFYNNRLQLLPDYKLSNSKEPALQFHKVEGLWENQTNPIEAQAVAEQITLCIQNYPEKEIGVVTFNAPQQQLILDYLDELASSGSIIIPPSLFVKNIENVQGDEKDIIIFSIGYAPDKEGRLNMQFGSLNVAGGENRLNVAVTRAREKVIVVSSIWPEELKLQGTRNDGPKLLRAYLEYVRNVSSDNDNTVNTFHETHSGSWYLFKYLNSFAREKNPTLSLNPAVLPFSDIVVSNHGEQLGVILTDDILYSESLTVKEPQAYIPFLLTEKNWKFIRLFSRDWWMHQEKVETELSKFLYALQQEVE